MSVIFQDFTEYQFTARENIRVGYLALRRRPGDRRRRDAGAVAVIRGAPPMKMLEVVREAMLRSAILAHAEAFGAEALDPESPVLDVFVAEANLAG